jgi:hypothetical protein
MTRSYDMTTTSYKATNAALQGAIKTASLLSDNLRNLSRCRNEAEIMVTLELIKLATAELAEFAERRLSAQRLMVARRRIKREQAAAEVRP